MTMTEILGAARQAPQPLREELLNQMLGFLVELADEEEDGEAVPTISMFWEHAFDAEMSEEARAFFLGFLPAEQAA